MNTTFLFGPEWDLNLWTDSDDRVRGGSSVSELVPSTDGVFFRGKLDIETLGGAGFASQRTIAQDQTWDLTGNDGIELNVIPSDGKRYTFSLTDEIPERRRDGREQSALVWEYDFCASGARTKVCIPWKDLRATYRGRQVDDARPLDLSRIRRFRIMARR
ncbi:uncharacterized protein N7511_003482 [Penicillium nucicola]|uniref:uncharacterized protein n=1 Tax=Penicillium nucicola TaxID=1850975 RepID=UPI0025455074|nr:uncharacterized protein N7511_003482 [Penicillium nucicola]KAJ5771431.1 hypothetical protein N7511_003482 [Penicillium nucicola]